MLMHVYSGFEKIVKKLSGGHLELPYGPGFVSYANIWLVCVHPMLRRLNQLLLTIENEHFPHNLSSPTQLSPLIVHTCVFVCVITIGLVRKSMEIVCYLKIVMLCQ